jgi:peptidoglycan/xylan/chitin deacetylase (PgdA/CDA1 family)
MMQSDPYLSTYDFRSLGMLRRIKLKVLESANSHGVTARLLNSRWRQERLAILCYHGISLADEHKWKPQLFITPETFRSRLEVLKQNGCNVLSLDEAIKRLYAHTLPPKCVVLTFDDGNYDFYRHAFPVLKEFGFPATVYLTTYYSYLNRPVFDVMISYLLYKGEGSILDWPEVIGRGVELNGQNNSLVDRYLKAYVRTNALSGIAKDDFARELANRLNINYDALCEQRLLHLMNQVEVQEIASHGIDVQLHTHRHRVSSQYPLFKKELEDNSSRIQELTGSKPVHFCYPGGFLQPQFPTWLAKENIASGTTCEFGLANAKNSRYLIPRVLDASHMSSQEFMGWVSGVLSFFPQRSISPEGSNVQLMENPIESTDSLLLKLGLRTD